MKTINEHLEEIWDIAQSDKTDYIKRYELVDKIAEIRREGISQMTAASNENKLKEL